MEIKQADFPSKIVPPKDLVSLLEQLSMLLHCCFVCFSHVEYTSVHLVLHPLSFSTRGGLLTLRRPSRIGLGTCLGKGHAESRTDKPSMSTLRENKKPLRLHCIHLASKDEFSITHGLPLRGVLLCDIEVHR